MLALRDGQGQVIATATTDDQGFYKFNVLPPDVYSIEEAVNPGPYAAFSATPGTVANQTDGTAEEVCRYINREELLRLWRRLWLPPHVRQVWEPRLGVVAS